MGEEDALRRVLDGALDAVIATDGSGAIMGWNRAAEALFGWPKREALGRMVHDLIVPDRDREEFARRLAALPCASSCERHETALVHASGEEIPVELAVTGTRLEDCVVITGFVRDLRERKRAERLRDAEHRIARFLATVPDGRELVARSQPIIAEGLGWGVVEGWMLDGDELRLVARRPADGGGLEPARDVAERARDTGTPLALPGALAVPVVIGGEVLGVTVVRDAPDRVARDDELAALAAITHQLEHYGERRRAERRIERETVALAAVARATRRLSAATSSAEARQALCDAAHQVCRSSVAFLAEPDADSGDLVVTAVTGQTPNEEGLPQRLGPGTAIHRIHETGEPFFTDDATTDARASHAVAARAGVHSSLVQPVRRGDTALGVLGVAWAERIGSASEQVRVLMSLLADEGAIALSRAEVFTGLAIAARTDQLTGLTNLRGWEETLSREVARAGRTGRPLAMAMLDMDGLKEINDAGGHQAGDRALRSAVSAWRAVVRDSDVLARLGGDEFAVVLPECDGEGAQILGERLRTATPAGTTCSVGTARWQPGESAERLLQRADAALYAAKDAGRNRTVAAQ